MGVDMAATAKRGRVDGPHEKSADPLFALLADLGRRWTPWMAGIHSFFVVNPDPYKSISRFIYCGTINLTSEVRGHYPARQARVWYWPENRVIGHVEASGSHSIEPAHYERFVELVKSQHHKPLP